MENIALPVIFGLLFFWVIILFFQVILIIKKLKTKGMA